VSNEQAIAGVAAKIKATRIYFICCPPGDIAQMEWELNLGQKSSRLAPQPCITRSNAWCYRFFTLIQCSDRPPRYGRSERFDTKAFKAELEAFGTYLPALIAGEEDAVRPSREQG
jgi:hypothetical protein